MSEILFDSAEKQPSIFISYAHNDGALVSRFTDFLMAQGFSVWIDKTRIEAGEDFHAAIDLNITTCEVVLVFLSKHYVNKPYCQGEFRNAYDNQKTIITVCLDTVTKDFNSEAAYMFNCYAGLNALQYGKGIMDDDDFRSVCHELVRSSIMQYTRLSEAERQDKRMTLTTSTALMDRLDSHRETVYKTSGNYHLDEIHTELFPALKDEDMQVAYYDADRQELPLFHFLKTSAHTHLLLIGDGGMGKTVSMMKICSHMHRQQIPAVFIPLRSIDFSRDSLKSYIQRVACHDNGGYWNELCRHAQTPYDRKPNLILLLDGVNEIGTEPTKRLFHELTTEVFPAWVGAQVVISSRYDLRSTYNIEQKMKLVHMEQLTAEQIRQYLDKCGLPPVPDGKLLRLLGVPLLLSLYANAEAYRGRYDKIPGIELEERPDTAGKIIGNFLKTQLHRAFGGVYSSLPEHLLVLEYILPAIAHHMIVNDNCFSISKKDLQGLLKGCKRDVRLRWYQEDRLEDIYFDLDLDGCEVNPSRLLNLAVRGLHFLQHTPEDTYEFLHHYFRDYFAACHLSNDLGAINADPSRLSEADPAVCAHRFDGEVLAFLADITGEQRAMPVLTGDDWVFPGKDRRLAPSRYSPAEQMLGHFRDREGPAAQNAVRNLLMTMRIGRRKLLGDCDFSRLDLRGCHMNSCRFTQWHIDKIYPSIFDGAWMDRSFLVAQGHEGPVTAICTDGKDLIFSGDANGVVRIYDQRAQSWCPSIHRQDSPVVDLAWDSVHGCVGILYDNIAHICPPDGSTDRLTVPGPDRSKKYRYLRFDTEGTPQIASDLEPLIYYTPDGQRIAPHMDYDVPAHCAQWHPTQLTHLRSYIGHNISSNFFNEETGHWWQHRALLARRDALNLRLEEEGLPPMEKVYLRLDDDGAKKGGSVQCIRYHPSGDRFLVSIQDLILEYDDRTMTLLQKRQLSEEVRTVCYGPDDTILAGSGNNVVVLAKDLSVKATLSGVELASIIAFVPTMEDTEFYLTDSTHSVKLLDSHLRVQRIRSGVSKDMRFTWCIDRLTGEHQMLFLPTPGHPHGSRYDFASDRHIPLGWRYKIPDHWPNYDLRDHQFHKMSTYILRVEKQPPFRKTRFVNYGGIWIFGCSFRELRGDMARDEEQKLIIHNGGNIYG